MNSKRVFYIMIGLLILLASVGIGGVVLGDKMLKKQSDKLVALKLDNKVLDEQQTELLQAKKDVEKYSSLEVIAKTVVPQDKDQARTVREIVNLASAAGITLSTISFPPSTLGAVVPKAVVTPDSSSSTTKSTTPPVTQVKAVDGIPGVYQLEITVGTDNTNPIPYSRLIDFLTKLEQNRHTAQVSTISVLPSAKNRDLVSFTLTVNAYIKP
jgi:hypothetical protein